MTFFEELQSHRGGILRIKSELYWYGGRGWDGTPDRICLVLDAVDAKTRIFALAAAIAAGARDLAAAGTPELAALLLIDGAPHWVWVTQADVELIT